MPPKFNLAERAKKAGAVVITPIGLAPVLPKGPILATDTPFFLDEEKSRLQEISGTQKSRFIANAEDIEDKMPLYSILGVNFSILNKDILDKMSVVDVSSKISRLDDKFVTCGDSRNSCARSSGPIPPPLPSENSVTSYTEMGVMENGLLCPKCNKTNMDCPGHLGQITLNKHYIHPMFMEYAIWTLMSVCNSCSKSLVSEDYLKQTGIDGMRGAPRLKKIAEEAKFARCENSKTSNCVPNPEYSTKNLKDSYKVKYFISKKDKDSPNIKEIEDIEKIFDSINVEDAKLLGFTSGAHPRDLIMKSFAVIPPCARPFTVRDGQRKEDHLTTAYDEIIKNNHDYLVTTPDAKYKGYNTLKDEEGLEANCRRRYERDLHFHISHFIDNSDGKYCRSPTEKIRGIKQRIVKKEGLIRGNIMGKRVNFCGRSVAGPDASLKFGEVALPESMAKVLTVPEMVHEKNLDFILDLWEKKKINTLFLGHSSLKNRRIRVTEKTYDKYKPIIGDKVERQMMDGDVVLLNRQPTLYKYSLIGNRVKIVDRKTIGLHMVETKMRQADFDGDELNVHALQALDARVEAYTFANVQAAVQSALTPSSMIGIIYNSLSSVWMMTNSDPEVILSEEQIEYGHSLLTNKEYLVSLPERLKKYNINPRSGKALFSALLPPDFYYKNSKEFEGKEMKIEIKDGVLVSGRISSNDVGKKGGTIQGSIWKWYGQDKAVSFITDCTFLTDWFVLCYGLTFGYNEICLPEEGRKLVEAAVKNNMREAQENINMLGPELPGMTLTEKKERENKILKHASAAATKIKVVAQNLVKSTNHIRIMQDSGAKGSDSNTTSIMALVGQITVSSGRSKKKLSQGTRCNPYFDFKSEELSACGFVQNNYLTGLTPSEMYFLAETSREGVANTALTTADTGAMHHRLVKVMEDVKVEYDGSVRNARGTIYQFSYYDGYDVGELVYSKAKNTGKVTSFINLQEAANRINASYE
jgi:DNA-directed RNA polymerase subunit A'